MTRKSAQKLIRQQISEFTLENPQTSVQNSVEFLKKLTVIAVSSISFLRNIFPATAFSERKLQGMKIRILKGIDDIPGTMTMINWIKSAFSAVELRFLKKMILVIKKQDVDTVLEIYTFNFSYNHEAIRCHLLNESTGNELVMENPRTELPDDIKASTQQLIRSILTLTTTMKPLPDDCEISMRLEFHDNVPDNYELPEYFKPVESLGIQFPPDTYSLKLGKIETKFSTFAVSSKSVLNQMEDIENENEEDEIVQSSQCVSENLTSFTSNGINNTQQVSAALDKDVEDEVTNKVSEVMFSVNLNERVVKCICELDDDCNANIKCNSCSTFQHKACYKFLENQEVGRHVCVNCHDPNIPSKTCIYPEIVNDKKRKDAALYRRALVLCLSNLRVSPNTFVKNFNLPLQEAQQMFSQLDIDGCLRPSTGKSNLRTIKVDHLKRNVLNLYFGKPTDCDNESFMETEENVLLINEPDKHSRKRNHGQVEVNSASGLPKQKRLKYAANQGMYNIQKCN